MHFQVAPPPLSSEGAEAQRVYQTSLHVPTPGPGLWFPSILCLAGSLHHVCPRTSTTNEF